MIFEIIELCEKEVWVSGTVQKPKMKWTLVLKEEKEDKVVRRGDVQWAWQSWILYGSDYVRVWISFKIGEKKSNKIGLGFKLFPRGSGDVSLPATL